MVAELDIDIPNRHLDLIVGDVAEIAPQLIIKPENATDKTVTYSSSAPELLEIDDKGILTVLADTDGNKTINIVTNDGSNLATSFTVNASS